MFTTNTTKSGAQATPGAIKAEFVTSGYVSPAASLLLVATTEIRLALPCSSAGLRAIQTAARPVW